MSIVDNDLDDGFFGSEQEALYIGYDSQTDEQIPVSYGLSVSLAPPEYHFQFNEGPLILEFSTDSSEIIRSNWFGAVLSLLYTDTLQPVRRVTNNAHTFKEMMKTTNGYTLRFSLRIDEITKNHRSRQFCFSLCVGGLRVVTSGFHVRTKRTKHKRTTSTYKVSYKENVKMVLAKLQWDTCGYRPHIDPSIGTSTPMLLCRLCKQTSDSGHTVSCPILILTNG